MSKSAGNHIYRMLPRHSSSSLMAQGTHVTANLFHDNLDQDFMAEVDPRTIPL